MRMGRAERFWLSGVLFAFVLLIRCGPEASHPPPLGNADASTPAPDASAPDASLPDASEPAPPVPRFQTVFSLALRESESVPKVRTYRLSLPSVLAGERVRVTFRAGAGGMGLLRASVSTEAAPTPVALPLPEGAAAVEPNARITSDAAPLAVAAGTWVTITFEATGSVATSAINSLPGSEQRDGAHADVEGPLGGAPRERPAAVVALEVDALPAPVMVVLGNSITEGYVSGRDDIRNAWPQLAAEQLGFPVLNAGVSAQGVRLAAEHLDEEVLSLTGISDCVLSLGTNDLHAFAPEALIAELNGLIERMAVHCRVWAATLLPKERTSVGSLSVVNERRRAINAWIRDEAPVEGVIDLEAAVRGASEDTFVPGLAEDGIHPSVLGQEKLGAAAANYIADQPAVEPAP